MSNINNKAQQGLEYNNVEKSTKSTAFKSYSIKPSEQTLPRPACFVLRGRIRSYTKGDLQDVLRLRTGPLPAFLTTMHGLRLFA